MKLLARAFQKSKSCLKRSSKVKNREESPKKVKFLSFLKVDLIPQNEAVGENFPRKLVCGQKRSTKVKNRKKRPKKSNFGIYEK